MSAVNYPQLLANGRPLLTNGGPPTCAECQEITGMAVEMHYGPSGFECSNGHKHSDRVFTVSYSSLTLTGFTQTASNVTLISPNLLANTQKPRKQVTGFGPAADAKRYTACPRRNGILKGLF